MKSRGKKVVPHTGYGGISQVIDGILIQVSENEVPLKRVTKYK